MIESNNNVCLKLFKEKEIIIVTWNTEQNFSGLTIIIGVYSYKSIFQSIFYQITMTPILPSIF